MSLRIGEGVRTPSGATGKVYSVSSDGMARVRIATGTQAGQIRRFRQLSLVSLDRRA